MNIFCRFLTFRDLKQKLNEKKVRPIESIIHAHRNSQRNFINYRIQIITHERIY
jgi:hypothetical protein